MGDTPIRDVSNHLLFEVATEVANRGEVAPGDVRNQQSLMEIQLAVSIQSSNRKRK
jgi:hypothetical protein